MKTLPDTRPQDITPSLDRVFGSKTIVPRLEEVLALPADKAFAECFALARTYRDLLRANLRITNDLERELDAERQRSKDPERRVAEREQRP